MYKLRKFLIWLFALSFITVIATYLVVYNINLVSNLMETLNPTDAQATNILMIFLILVIAGKKSNG